MGTLSNAFVWRLSVVYIGPKSRTERHRRTKIGTEVAHVTRDLDTTFKFKRSKVKVTRRLCSPPCWHIRRLQQWAWERVGRGKLLLRCRLLGGARRSGAHGGGEGRGHIVEATHLQLFTAGSPSSWTINTVITLKESIRLSTANPKWHYYLISSSGRCITSLRGQQYCAWHAFKATKLLT